jgi:hypothetical protein
MVRPQQWAALHASIAITVPAGSVVSHFKNSTRFMADS